MITNWQVVFDDSSCLYTIRLANSDSAKDPWPIEGRLGEAVTANPKLPAFMQIFASNQEG